jgi:hypothetical protein
VCGEALQVRTMLDIIADKTRGLLYYNNSTISLCTLLRRLDPFPQILLSRPKTVQYPLVVLFHILVRFCQLFSSFVGRDLSEDLVVEPEQPFLDLGSKRISLGSARHEGVGLTCRRYALYRSGLRFVFSRSKSSISIKRKNCLCDVQLHISHTFIEWSSPAPHIP